MDVATVTSLTSTISQGESGSSRIAQEVPVVPGNPISPKNTNPTPVGTPESPSPEAIAKGIKQLNNSFAQNGITLYASYQKDKITGIEVIQFRDQNTNEVIRQIPSKEMLAIAQSLALPQGWRGQLIYDKS